MKLSNKSILENKAAFESMGYALPAFDRETVAANTAARPEWVHFGAGNIFRAFVGSLCQQVLNEGLMDTGIVVAEGFDPEILDVAYRPYDNLCVSATLCADGRIKKTIIGSIVNSLGMVRGTEDWDALAAAFRAPTLKMASMTITEKGYNIKDSSGQYFPAVAADMENGPEKAESYIGKIAALCHERYVACAAPIAMVSMDNCSHNGARLEAAMLAFADAWEKAGLCKAGFAAYMKDPACVSFPWSMIDKITPRPDDSVKAMLLEDGLEDMELKVTGRRSFVAPFVNSEESQYLVIEDLFPNGRIPIDKAGVIYTSRDVVDMVETMKVCTCLNPLHTCLAVLGCLLGFERISAEMQDADLKKLVEIVGYKEGLPVVVDPGVISPRSFIDEVLGVRFPNPFLQDTPQRIATDTSQKIAIRFGNTIKKYAASEELCVKDLKCIPFVIGAWCRYLMAIDDNGNPFQPSDDPLMGELAPRFADVRLGESCDVHAVLSPVLSDERIMGVNLYEVGLGEDVEAAFASMLAGPGAVRKALHAAVNA
ncbi:MAG: mannitol dehydrogenase family protein [Clostridia bacterium]|nr:mannitol dehydrogenase family protein [Clostridia bacterium]